MTHARLLESMSRPEFYPHWPKTVEVIQTHISFIFIAGDVVYKVKKSVDFGVLDFTSLEKRKHHCNEEVRLNRRLASDVYLGLSKITREADGDLALGGLAIGIAQLVERCGAIARTVDVG